MAQKLRPVVFAKQADLEVVRVEVAELMAQVEELSEATGILATGMVGLMNQLTEMREALFEPDDGTPSENPQSMLDYDENVEKAFDEASALLDADDQADLMLHEPEADPTAVEPGELDLGDQNNADLATGEGMPEQESTEDRHARITAARRAVRDPMEDFKSANEGTPAERAALDPDPNAIGDVPDEGVLISPGTPIEVEEVEE